MGISDHQSFDFLSYTFRARSVRTKWGTFRVGFIPAISDKAKKGIRDEVARVSRTVLRGRGGEIPPRYSTNTIGTSCR